jgi:sterol desaturase/sphingolipid hydroxylase (fatty acid hydroxylase superfamily)
MRTPGGQVGAKLEGHAEVRLIIAAIIGSSLAVALWEFCRPRWQREFPALRRRLSNLGIWLANLVLAAFSFARPDTSRPELEAAIDVGLPSWPIVNPWSSFVMAFLLLDFALRSASLSACVPFLWRFHAMHHSDPDVDVTTSVRHHPIAYLMAAGFYWVVVLALDIPVAVTTIHALTVFAAASVTHGNVKFPGWLERLLQPLVITLDLHLIHHSISSNEANANFGAVLSVWDRLFGTLSDFPQQDRLLFGGCDLSSRECLKPSVMLLTPAATAPDRHGRHAERSAAVTGMAAKRLWP